MSDRSSYLVSILMPVRDAQPYLVPCLESIITQTHTSWELIAVNDHSRDGSEAVLRRYADRDSRVRFLENEGTGIIDALRTAYRVSAGDYITRMDADDLMEQNKIEVLLRNLSNAGKGNIALGLVKYISDTVLGQGFKRYEQWLNGLTRRGQNFSEIYKECVVPSPCWMLHREDLERIGAFESDRYPEDYDLCFRMAVAGLECIPSDVVLHQWRDYPTRTSRTHSHYADNSFIEIKCHYFMHWSRDEEKQLWLWGTGRKGKRIAQRLIDHQIPFRWITNNQRKIGLTIYGHEVENETEIDQAEVGQVIIAIANPMSQELVRSRLYRESGLLESFFFC